MEVAFLDTNVVLDLLDSHRKGHAQAKQLMAKLVEKETRIVVSEDMLSTIYYVIHDKPAVLEFIRWMTANWQIVPFGRSVIDQAVKHCQNSAGQDFEDTLQCYCAKENSCDLLISNDAAFVECGVLTLRVNDFLQKDNKNSNTQGDC